MHHPMKLLTVPLGFDLLTHYFVLCILLYDIILYWMYHGYAHYLILCYHQNGYTYIEFT